MTRTSTRTSTRTLALTTGALALALGTALGAAAPASATTGTGTGTTAHGVAAAQHHAGTTTSTSTSTERFTYRTVTRADGSHDRLVTAVGGRELVDTHGRPAPVPAPASGVHADIVTTSCVPGQPVNLTWESDSSHVCYYLPGTVQLPHRDLFHLYSGRWYGSIYYDRGGFCVQKKFHARQPVGIGYPACTLYIAGNA